MAYGRKGPRPRRDAELEAVVFVNSGFGFWDRLRLLFGGRICQKIVITTECKIGHYWADSSFLWIGFKPRLGRSKESAVTYSDDVRSRTPRLRLPLTEGKERKGGRGSPPKSERPVVRPQGEKPGAGELLDEILKSLEDGEHFQFSSLEAIALVGRWRCRWENIKKGVTQ